MRDGKGFWRKQKLNSREDFFVVLFCCCFLFLQGNRMHGGYCQDLTCPFIQLKKFSLNLGTSYILWQLAEPDPVLYSISPIAKEENVG